MKFAYNLFILFCSPPVAAVPFRTLHKKSNLLLQVAF